ncbi:hypothetical protein CANINC_003666 [Pichia inconspicua]|uniref:Nucleolar complex protein 14 n=1 Tax=Pichia inconspicua TaxID=52247 RepID=A0A4T0WY68_9ASCO|nr:hypothetical protein CANINC_003666 [[Candida] inconspicua]
MAGGKQLKKLRESLKNAGLTEQSFSKKKGKGKKGSQDKLRKDDKEQVLKEIREQFNPFDVKVSRNKRADAIEKKLTVGKPGISKQIGEESRKKEYEERMSRKGKAGGIVDRRFGEGNEKLSFEDKMLERFTRERLAKASKSSMYNLEDDENIDYAEDGDFGGLTHQGKSIALKDSIDEDDFFSKKRTVTDVDAVEAEVQQPERKKTKAEVMKEVIAKSKKYKHLRQQQQLENQDRVAALDEDFENVMDEISTVTATVKEVANEEKSKFDVEYEMKVTEAKLDKRAKPTERTKTEEELQREEEERLAENEKKRLARMEGDDEELRAEGAVADDLDDDFWAGSGDEENGFSVGSPREDESESESEEDEEEGEGVKVNSVGDADKPVENVITIGNKKIVVKPKIATAKLTCPQSLEELKKFVNNDYEATVTTIKNVFATYQPKLAAGNKEKLGVFTTVLLEYALELANETHGNENAGYVRLMDFLTKTVCNLTEKYPEEMLDAFRGHIMNMHERLLRRDENVFPLQQDAVLLALIGRTFSTSDKYHLVVIPALVIACEALEFMRPEESKRELFFGVFLCDLLLRYERISERVIPEVVRFLHRVLLAVVPQPEGIVDWEQVLVCSTAPIATTFTRKSGAELTAVGSEPLSIAEMFKLAGNEETDVFVDRVLAKAVHTLDNLVTKMVKSTPAAPELTLSFLVIVRHLVKHVGNTHAGLVNVASKLANIHRLSTNERRPLKIQQHRAVGIAQVAPRFSERFNPDHRSARSVTADPLDPVAIREEISKLKHQVKEEKKQALKELRRDTKFEAREQIKRKKKEYEEYHSKMAHIYNSIQTEEGAAKNEYERGKKKLRKGH